MATFLFSFLFVIIAMEAAEQNMKLYLFPENEVGGQCLDGSPAGFYYSPPISGSSNLWVIDLEGGGACSDEADCKQRAKGGLGSSTYWSKTHNPTAKVSDYINSNDPSINPDFYSGHQVYAPYCSGDAWSGQRKTPATNPDTWGFYFSGHLIFERIIQYLSYNLTSDSILNAEYILLTGTSAGGMGTFLNINWLYNEMKQTSKTNVTIKAAPVGGWIFPGNATDELSDPMMPPNDYPHWIKGENGGIGHQWSPLWDSYLDPICVSALGPNNSWNCGSVHNLYPYILGPVFVLENKFEKYQITSSMQMPTNVTNNSTIGYVEYYGIDMDRSIITQLVDEQNDKNGLFYPSCFSHTGGIFLATKGYTVKGYNGTELVGDWFWDRNKLPHFVYDTCNDENNKLPCNPTCPGYPPTTA